MFPSLDQTFVQNQKTQVNQQDINYQQNWMYPSEHTGNYPQSARLAPLPNNYPPSTIYPQVYPQVSPNPLPPIQYTKQKSKGMCGKKCIIISVIIGVIVVILIIVGIVLAVLLTSS